MYRPDALVFLLRTRAKCPSNSEISQKRKLKPRQIMGERL
ncbi:hypothetical protein PORCAN_73 [Porphyromonas crevioricanis JCM 13913]|nr:hypothetical protein PORCAN_73 [Porphyromonas crevioricanis JCM 13913]